MALRLRAPLALFALLAAAVYAVAVTMVSSAAFVRAPSVIGAAVAVDLTLVVPVLYWLTAVRRGGAALRTLVPVVLLSVVGARLVLPAEQRSFTVWARLAVAPAELLLIALVVRRVIAMARRSGAAHAGASSPAAVDVAGAIRHVVEGAIGATAPARAIAHELAVLYYALAPRPRPEVEPGATAFALERSAAVPVGLGIAIAAETGVVHLLVASRSATAAWVLTGLGLYGLVWLVGDHRALGLRPTLVSEGGLWLRVGLRASAWIERGRIAGVGRLPPGTLLERAPDLLDLARPALEANVLVELTEPLEVARILGLRTRARRIALAVERPEALVAALQQGRASPRSSPATRRSARTS